MMNVIPARMCPRLLAVLLSALAAGAVAQTGTQPQTRPAAPPTQPAGDDAQRAYVLLTTSKGDIVLELNREKAPITVDNFLSYVDKDFYSGTIFHRIMKTFMIQGGGFTKDMHQKSPSPPIQLESGNGLSNERGTIAMARTGEPNSATSQFFINVVDNRAKLDAKGPNTGYAVFGKVVAGMDVVDAIRDVPVGPDQRGEVSKPTETVTIEKVKRISADEANKLTEAAKPPTTNPR